jgi:plastocyanin
MKNRRALFLLLSLVCFLFRGCGSTSSNSPQTVTITIPAGATFLGTAAYGANPLHVAVGTKVVWKNSDTMTHTATSTTGVFDTSDIAAGASSNPITFDTAGTFPYFCTLHGAASMSGVIIVP